MSFGRRRKYGDQFQPGTHRVTVTIDADLAGQLDQYQNAFGIDSRGLALVALAKAGISALPLESAAFEIVHAAAKEHRKAMTDATIRFHEEQAAIFRGGFR